MKEFATVDNPLRQQAKLPVSLCFKINEFLAPRVCPEMLHIVPQGGPVTYHLFGAESTAELLAPYTTTDVCVGALNFVSQSEEEASPVPDFAMPQASFDATFSCHMHPSMPSLTCSETLPGSEWTKQYVQRWELCWKQTCLS